MRAGSSWRAWSGRDPPRPNRTVEHQPLGGLGQGVRVALRAAAYVRSLRPSGGRDRPGAAGHQHDDALHEAVTRTDEKPATRAGLAQELLSSACAYASRLVWPAVGADARQGEASQSWMSFDSLASVVQVPVALVPSRIVQPSAWVSP